MPRGIPKSGFRAARRNSDAGERMANIRVNYEPQSHETDAQIEQRIADRFEILDVLTEACVVGNSRAMIVSGPAGLGKSYTVEKRLTDWDPSETCHTIVKGYVRATGLVKLLYQFRHPNNVIVFDDADAIFFDDVRVPVGNRLGEEGEGFRIAMKGLDGGRINIATCSVGAAQGAFNAAQRYLGERQQFGKKLADFQALQFRLADMATELVAARQMIRLAASKLDAGARDATTYCAMAKRFATDAGFNVCNEALQLHGGYGYLRDYPLERLLRDSRVHQILEGTNEIMRVIIARRMLDADALDSIR